MLHAFGILNADGTLEVEKILEDVSPEEQRYYNPVMRACVAEAAGKKLS